MKLTIPREDFHQKVYFFGLALLVCCLPLSRYVLSISQFLLALNWLTQGRFREKAAMISRRPSLLLFAAVFVIYVIGLLYTHHVETGAARIKNALPLLLLPLILGTSPPLSGKNVKWLLMLFSAAVMLASLICLMNYFAKSAPANGDFRKISIFMLHIRFSLMIVMAIFILLYLAFYKSFSSTNLEKAGFFLSACFLIAFLFFLRSFTGIIIFLVMTTVFIFNTAVRCKRPSLRNATLFLITGSLMALMTYTSWTYFHNFQVKPIRLSTLEEYTANGNPYTHNASTGALENGHYIDLYVCEPELKREWNKISTISYDSIDRRGQRISLTIRRYLTSKGFRKDSAAIGRLNKPDIQRIENGLANYKFRENPGIYQRLYETLWEIHILSRTGYVQKHSLGQRLVFLITAKTIFENNIWSGVGTGDVYDAMLQSAQGKMPAIDPQWEGKPHNQFIFFILAFGLPGFLCILYCFVYPVIARKSYRCFLFNIFAGIILISMLTLDTLESYDSMVFFAFFYCLFVFGTELQENMKT